MDLEPRSSAPKTPAKLNILLMDGNAERRALRQRVLTLQGADVVGASDLTEASSIWHRDRYDLVLMDIRADHRGCMSWRDEIKKEKPKQVVVFLVGKPNYVDLDPLLGSYVAEAHGTQWGDSMRLAIRESCASLPQRNGFVEAGWRIAAARKMNGAPHTSEPEQPVESAQELRSNPENTETK